MTLEASSAALVADVEHYMSVTAPAAVRPCLPANDPAEPERGCSAAAELLVI